VLFPNATHEFENALYFGNDTDKQFTAKYALVMHKIIEGRPGLLKTICGHIFADYKNDTNPDCDAEYKQPCKFNVESLLDKLKCAHDVDFYGYNQTANVDNITEPCLLIQFVKVSVLFAIRPHVYQFSPPIGKYRREKSPRSV
jgi:hypothetical protein